MQYRKGITLMEAPMAVLTIVFLALVAVVGVKIAVQLQTGEAVTSATYLTAANVTAGIQQITSQLTLIGLIIGLAIVIRILWGSFGGMFRGGTGGGL